MSAEHSEQEPKEVPLFSKALLELHPEHAKKKLTLHYLEQMGKFGIRLISVGRMPDTSVFALEAVIRDASDKKVALRDLEGDKGIEEGLREIEEDEGQAISRIVTGVISDKKEKRNLEVLQTDLALFIQAAERLYECKATSEEKLGAWCDRNGGIPMVEPQKDL